MGRIDWFAGFWWAGSMVLVWVVLLTAALQLGTPVAASSESPSVQPAEQLSRRRVSAWTTFHSCGNMMCPNMSRQIQQIVRHADVLDTVMPYTGGAAPQYQLENYTACYYNGTQRLQIKSGSSWAAFRFGGPSDSPIPGGAGMPVHICAPFPDAVVSAWVEPLRRAGVGSMPVLQGWPAVWPKAGTDDGFFDTAVALAKKFDLDGWNLDVEPGQGGANALEEYAEFLTTFAARMSAAGLRVSTAEPNGFINTTLGPSPWGSYVGNFTGYASIGHSGAEVQTMNTYYGVQPLTVKGLLPANIASWKTAVPASSLTIGFAGLYAAWGSDNCAQVPGGTLFNVSGVNQTCTLKLSLADVVAAKVSSVAVFTLNAFGCGTRFKFPMCQWPVEQVWPPESWWAVLREFRHNTMEDVSMPIDTSWTSKTDDDDLNIQPDLTSGRPRNTCDVMSVPFHAVGDGIHDDTLSLRRALEECDSVLLPRGKSFLTGPLNITSNQMLVVDGTLLASTRIDDYPLVAPITSYGWSIDSNCFPFGVEIVPGALNYQSIINSWNASNVTVTGSGVIDGQGQPWWDRCTRCHYPPPIGGWPHANGSCLEAGRPMLLQFTWVDGLSVHGESVGAPLTIQNSPFWTFTPTFSQGIRISDLRILAPMNVIGNTDGIDISSSRDAIIRNVFINNSDDGVCMNSGAEEYGMNMAIPTEDVLVENVTCPGPHAGPNASIYSGGRGGFRVGIQPGGVRNVTFRNSVLNGQRGLSLLGVVGGGGYIHDVLFQNITNPRGISFGNYGGSPWMKARYHPHFLPMVWNVEYRDIRENPHCGNCGAMANGSVCPNLTYTGVTTCGALPPPPPPPINACPNRQHSGGFVPWVAVSNMSNVYGEIPRPFNQSSPGLPFFGLFDSAEGCQAACEARSNCTQYSWGLDVPQFELHCFGRCDNIWRLHPVPSQYTVVAARRVHAGPDGGSGGSASLIRTQDRGAKGAEVTPKLRYGCKRRATDQFGSVVTFLWPVCIPIGQHAPPVNMNESWPNWGPVEGDFPSLQACKDSGCK